MRNVKAVKKYDYIEVFDDRRAVSLYDQLLKVHSVTEGSEKTLAGQNAAFRRIALKVVEDLERRVIRLEQRFIENS